MRKLLLFASLFCTAVSGQVMNMAVGSPVFTGTGMLNDATVSGPFVGVRANHNYTAVIASAGSTDLVNYSRDGVATLGSFALTTMPQPIYYVAGFVSAASWSAGTATYTVGGPHGLTNGALVTITGASPSGYNVSLVPVLVVDPTHFSVPVASNPGTWTSGGAVAANDGLSIQWGAITGHTAGDTWTISVQASGLAGSFSPIGVGATVSRGVQDKLRDVVSVKDFGAKGDGVTDDTAAIARAVNALCFAGGGHLEISFGTYMLNPVSYALLPMCDNIEISGLNGTLMIASGAGSFDQIFGTRGQTVNNFYLHDLTINMNSTGNPLVSTGDLSSHCRCVFVFGNPTGTLATGSNVQIHNVSVSDVRSTWVFRSGASPTSITNNQITNIGGGTVTGDSSIFYLDGTGEVVANNQIVSASPNQNLAVTAIETHGDRQSVTGNVIANMQTGMNITGEAPTTTVGVTVTGNTLTGVYQCIDLWSLGDLGAAGYGLEGATVTGNYCRVNQLSYLGLEAANEPGFGIQLNTDPSLGWKSIKVNHNLVEFDLSTSTSEPIPTSNGMPGGTATMVGIGYLDNTASGNACVDCDFGYNTVINSPVPAFRWQGNGTNISFDGDIAIDSGSHLNPAIADVWRSCFFLGLLYMTPIGGDMSANGSKCIDDLAVSRMVYGYVLNASTTGQFSVDGAEVTCVDATCGSLSTSGGSAFNIVGPPSPAPYINGRVAAPAGAVLPNGGSGGTAPLVGSQVWWINSNEEFVFQGAQGWSNPDVGHITPLTGSNLFNCGAGASVTGTDRSGIVTLGTSPGTPCLVLFTASFTNAPVGSVSALTPTTATIFSETCGSIGPVGGVSGVPNMCSFQSNAYVVSNPIGITTSEISINNAGASTVFGWSLHGN